MTRRSKVALVFAVLSVVYSVVQAVARTRSQAALTDLFESEPFLAGLGSVAGTVASIALLPHFLSSVAASVLGLVGFVTRNDGLLLAAAIMITVAVVLFFVAALWLVPLVVLGFWGYSRQRRINHTTAA